MAIVGEAVIKLDTAGEEKIEGKVNGALSKIGAGATKAGAVMSVGLTAPILLATRSMFNMASDYEESLNKVKVAFGETSDQVINFSEGTLESYGIAKGTALEMASLFGDMGTSMQIPQAEASNMSQSLVGLAGDLASFKNVGLDQASNALKGIFTGEGESLKSLGVVMTDATLSAYALAQGIKKPMNEMTQAEKVQLRYNYVMASTKNAQGDFARTSDGSANSARIMTESIKELQVAFGQKLLPVITPLIQKTTSLIQGFTNLDGDTQGLILKIGGIVAVIGPALLIFGKFATAINAIQKATKRLHIAQTALSIAQKIGTGIQMALNSSLWANPITWIVIAIIAFIAILVLLWVKSEAFRGFIIGLWETIKTGLMQAWETIKAVFGFIFGFIVAYVQFIIGIYATIIGAVVNFAKAVWGAITGAFDKVKNFIMGFIGFVKGIGGNIVEGLKSGIQNAWSSFMNWITKLLGGMKDKILGFFGIKSPSQWARDMVGKNLVLGLKIGMGGELDKLKSAIPLMLDSTFSGSLNPALAQGKSVVNNDIKVVVNVEQDNFGNIVSKAKLYAQGTQAERLARI